MTVFESCAIAFPQRDARLIATRATFFTTAPPSYSQSGSRQELDGSSERIADGPILMPDDNVTADDGDHSGRILEIG
jgi:hypothetical protein